MATLSAAICSSDLATTGGSISGVSCCLALSAAAFFTLELSPLTFLPPPSPLSPPRSSAWGFFSGLTFPDRTGFFSRSPIAVRISSTALSSLEKASFSSGVGSFFLLKLAALRSRASRSRLTSGASTVLTFDEALRRLTASFSKTPSPTLSRSRI